MYLSIIISHRNDPVMLNITMNSALEAFKAIHAKCEIIVVDNSDDANYEAITKYFPGFYHTFRNIKIVKHSPPSNHNARMKAAELATGKYILCVDSHMLFGHNVLADAVNFINSHSNLGFCHFPMRRSDRGSSDIHRGIGIGANGTPYSKRTRIKPGSQKILWKFMPWMCNRKWYLNTLRGYFTHANHSIIATGGEMLQQIKSWMLGYENWIMNTNPIIHIGPFTRQFRNIANIPYRGYELTDNYPIGFGVILAFYILGGPDFGYKQAKLAEPRLRQIHKIKVDPWWDKAKELGYEEHEWLTKNSKHSFEEIITKWRSASTNQSLNQ
jgi:glycosyltransferase involved in cell wall biosynthesis